MANRAGSSLCSATMAPRGARHRVLSDNPVGRMSYPHACFFGIRHSAFALTSVIRAGVSFAVVIITPRLIIEMLKAFETMIGLREASRWKIPETVFAIGLPWKLLVYPHDLAYRHQSRLLPDELALGVAVLGWTIVGAVVTLYARERTLRTQLLVSSLAVVAVGVTRLILGQLAGISLPFP